MNNARLSIVTISYNQAEFLERALLSVIRQKSSDVEYIVIDPGSTDGSIEILERYARDIDRLVLEPDKGPGDGLNKGFRAASGDVFAYLNSDDEFRPGAFAFASEFMRTNPETDVLVGAVRVTDAQGKPRLRKRCPDQFDLKRYAAGICTLNQQATFIRRRAFERVGGFNVANRTCWDGELLVDIGISGGVFASVDKVLGDYRVHSQSLTGTGLFMSDRFRREHQRIVEKIKASGVDVDEGAALVTKRWLYKANVLRHLRYLLVR